MDVMVLDIPGVMVLRPKRHVDDRGFFCETFNKRTLAQAGINLEFVQDNHSYSRRQATVRGLHFQLPPQAQAKLVRVVRGSIFDVAVDLRRSSATYGKFVTATLSANNGKQLFVPEGFAHGFMTLEADTEVTYKAGAYYAPELDAGIAWNDPDIGIEWPFGWSAITMSERDKKLPRLSEFDSLFK